MTFTFVPYVPGTYENGMITLHIRFRKYWTDFEMLGHFTDNCLENLNWLRISASFTKNRSTWKFRTSSSPKESFHTNLHILIAAFMSRLFSPTRTISCTTVMLVTSAQTILLHEWLLCLMKCEKAKTTQLKSLSTVHIFHNVVCTVHICQETAYKFVQHYAHTSTVKL